MERTVSQLTESVFEARYHLTPAEAEKMEYTAEAPFRVVVVFPRTHGPEQPDPAEQSFLDLAKELNIVVYDFKVGS